MVSVDFAFGPATKRHVEKEICQNLKYKRDTKNMGNVLWSIINLLILLFIGWPVAGFCAGIYIFIAPFGACIAGCNKINDILQKGVEWPRKLGVSIANGDNNFGC